MFVGDININIFDNNDFVHNYLNIMGENGLTSAINTFTRVEGESRSCIDHLFIKDIKQCFRCVPVVLESNITDHFSIIMQLIEHGKKQTINNCINTKQFLDNNKLILELQNENWAEVYSCSTIESATDLFVEKLKSNVSNCTKIIKIKNKDLKKNCG